MVTSDPPLANYQRGEEEKAHLAESFVFLSAWWGRGRTLYPTPARLRRPGGVDGEEREGQMFKKTLRGKMTR